MKNKFVCTVRVCLACLVFGNGLEAVEEKSGAVARKFSWPLEGIMFRKLSGLLFILVVLQATVSIPSAGQSCTGKLSIQRVNFLSSTGTGAPGCFWVGAFYIPFYYC